MRAAPDPLFLPQVDFKLGDPIPTTWHSSQYKWRETEQWSREPVNYGMSFEEAARTGRPKSVRTCSKCGSEVSTNEEDHKEECARVIKRRKKNKLKRAGVCAPVQKRKPDAGPKWYEFKVVPLNRHRHYKTLVRGTLDNGRPKYIWEGDRDKTRRLNARGMDKHMLSLTVLLLKRFGVIPVKRNTFYSRRSALQNYFTVQILRSV